MSTEFDEAALVSALKGVLKSKGVSLRKVSDALGIPYRTVQNYMGGESRLPVGFVFALCKYLGVGADYFIYGDFRPHAQEMYEAVFDVLEETGKLPPPHQTDPPATSFFERNSFAAMAAARIIERYDRHRDAWLKRRDGGLGYEASDQYRTKVPMILRGRQADEVGE